MREERRYFVYIMTNPSRTLYTGMTNSLRRRVREHKLKVTPGFATKYNITRLVHFESFEDVRNAIEREKQIKALDTRQTYRTDRVHKSQMERFIAGMGSSGDIPIHSKHRVTLYRLSSRTK
jgi:putative endonuclease